MTERFGEPDPCCCPCGCCDEDTIHSEIRVKFSGIGSRLGSAEWDREDGFVVTLEDGIVLVDECIWTGSGPAFGTMFWYVRASLSANLYQWTAQRV